MRHIAHGAAGKKKERGEGRWIIFFYSVPSRPVGNRVRLWRKLAKAGAVSLKGAVYILPFREEHREFLQWLMAEVKGMRGDGDFVRTDRVEMMGNDDVVALFTRQREKDYAFVAAALDDLERKLGNIRKGTFVHSARTLADQLERLSKGFEEVRRTDFFISEAGVSLGKRMERLRAELKRLPGGAADSASPRGAVIASRRTEDYQGRVWVTRQRPFIDRMASAWLIRRFIDPKAIYRFIDEKEAGKLDKRAVLFDTQGGEFTHAGDLCTFEVLVRSFGIRDRTVKKMAEIVHELDIRDDKYRNPEAKGIEDILSGIRKSVREDAEMLDKGMAVFEMLYESKAR